MQLKLTLVESIFDEILSRKLRKMLDFAKFADNDKNKCVLPRYSPFPLPGR